MGIGRGKRLISMGCSVHLGRGGGVGVPALSFIFHSYLVLEGTRMLSILLALATASAPQASSSQSESQDMFACAEEALRSSVGPHGVLADWPVASSLPAELEDQIGHKLSDSRDVYDGYSHYLLRDDKESVLYVVQRGGFAGNQIVYGPLQIPTCATSAL